MKWLTQPWVMATASAALVVGAAALVLRPPPAQPRPTPSPVAAGDHEIAWLANTTTNALSWERLVEGVKRAAERLQDDHPGAAAENADAAFPRQTTAVPEVALRLPNGAGRLVFRWYKVTTDWKTGDWVEALLQPGRPPPLAIIGGNSSDAARELAGQLRRHTEGMPEKDCPLLLLTTATADRVVDPDAPADALPDSHKVDLTSVYPRRTFRSRRTFRFCFSNVQMAAAVLSFLRYTDDLQPDVNSVHMVQWDDDAYSRDLTDGFLEVLRRPRLAADNDAPGCGAAGPSPSPAAPVLVNPERIASSVGSFLTPNHYESDGVGDILQDLERAPAEPRPAGLRGISDAWGRLMGLRAPRPLLVATGQSAPVRRFLAELARTSPARARRLVVATGDALSFNTVYRDRRVAWPVQELPFPLVFFCHYNPMDKDTFVAEGDAPRNAGGDAARTTSGTDDLLMYSTIVEAVAQAFDRDGMPTVDTAELSRRLLDIRHVKGKVGYPPEGTPLFCPNGDRRGGAGEAIVCVRPQFAGDRVLPEATIEVWFSRESVKHEPGAPPQPAWKRHDPDKPPLHVSYEPLTLERNTGP